MTQPELFDDFSGTPVFDPPVFNDSPGIPVFPKEDIGFTKSYVDDYGIQRCICCNQKVAVRKKFLDLLSVKGGIIMREYAVKYNLQTVCISQVAHLMTKGQYCNVNYLVRFGLAYKKEGMKAGEYGIPRKRRHDFLNGERTVARYYLQDNTIIGDQRVMSEERISILQVPNVNKIRDQTSGRFTEYSRNHNFD